MRVLGGGSPQSPGAAPASRIRSMRWRRHAAGPVLASSAVAAARPAAVP
jgi:hypothetical protein